MGKQGPCYHCGVTSTPLWRNGPPEKPVLCNACGSRWRTKGSLANYTPLHSRADFEEQKAAARVRSISLSQNKEVKYLKRKQSYDNSMTSGGVAVAFDYNHFSQKFVDEETSNRSSSGSAMSNSDAQFGLGSADVSDLTGPAQSVVWDSMVPSRKRTCVNRPKQSSVEKLTKDLHAIMNEQQSSCFSGTSEEDLLLESVTTPMCSFEMENGAVLFRDPSSIAKEEESEASSLSVDRKQFNKSSEMYYSQRAGLPPHSSGGKGFIFPSPNPRIVKIRRSNHEQDNGHEKLKRDMLQHEKLQILGSHNSPLRGINLKDVINFEEFVKQLTNQEQEQLLKYLPSVDTTELPDGLKNLFDSSEFKENLSSFQKLLGDGVFDNSLIGVKAEECKTLKGLALSNFGKSKWVECHNRLIKESRSSRSESHAATMTGKRACDVQSQNFLDTMMMKKAKRGKLGSINSSRYGYEEEELVMESDGCCLISPRSLFALHEDNSEQDLLLLVDSSNSSFPQAELLNTNLTTLHPPPR